MLLKLEERTEGKIMMSVESTRKVMRKYWDSGHSDVSMMADNVVFTVMATGEETQGPDAVLGLLNYFYHGAFDARGDIHNEMVSEGKAVAEADFVGKHIGEFAGIPATGKDVNVPLCVVYDLVDDQIKGARIYLEMPVLMAQLGASS
jgi:steroid delta-isomerase-like uncharacterized protein